MQYLFVTKPIKIVRESKMLKLEGEEHLKKVPVNLIKGVFLFGKAELTRGARNLLLENNKDIYFFNHKAEFMGVLSNAKLKSNYRYRLLQYKNIENLEVAKFIVQKKIETIEEWSKKSLQRYKEKLKIASNLNEVLGVEGSSSLYLFAKVREILNSKGIEFEKREYRPVKDRVNGLLSFAYSMYYGFLHTIALDEGFDPYIGFLHKKRGTHMAFVSDLMEEKRVLLTHFVVTLLVNQKIVNDDFDELFLNWEGRIKFLNYFVEMLARVDHYSFVNELKDFLQKLD